MRFVKNIVLIAMVGLFVFQSTVGFAFDLLTGLTFNVGVQLNDKESGSAAFFDVWYDYEDYLSRPDHPRYSSPLALCGQKVPTNFANPQKPAYFRIRFMTSGIDPEKVIDTRMYLYYSDKYVEIKNVRMAGITAEQVDQMSDEQIAELTHYAVFPFAASDIPATGEIGVSFVILHKDGTKTYYVFIFSIETDREQKDCKVCSFNLFPNPSGELRPAGLTCDDEAELDVLGTSMGDVIVPFNYKKYGIDGQSSSNANANAGQANAGQVQAISNVELVNALFALQYPVNIQDQSIAGKKAIDTGMLYILSDSPRNIRIYRSSDAENFLEISDQSWNRDKTLGKYFLGLKNLQAENITILPKYMDEILGILPCTSNVVVSNNQGVSWIGLSGTKSGVAILQ